MKPVLTKTPRRMAGVKRRALLALMAGLSGSVLLTGALSRSGQAAEYVVLSPEELSRRLHAAGFSDIARLRQRGQVYTAEATSRNGLRARLVLNGTSGEILGLRFVDNSAQQIADEGLGRR